MDFTLINLTLYIISLVSQFEGRLQEFKCDLSWASGMVLTENVVYQYVPIIFFEGKVKIL